MTHIFSKTLHPAPKKPVVHSILSIAALADSAVLASGVWHDSELLFHAKGTKRQAISLTEEEKGGVIISDESNLGMHAERLIASLREFDSDKQNIATPFGNAYSIGTN